jgi:hypothetical protein
VITLDLSANVISQFPSLMIYNMPNLKNLSFQNNFLTDVPSNAFFNVALLDTISFANNELTSFDFWALNVFRSADFSNNQITTITNKYFFTTFLNGTMDLTPTILLNNNGPTIIFNDGVYEMYNQCQEAYNWYFSEATNLTFPWFTFKIGHINFGGTKIRCSCDQTYFLAIFDSFFKGWGLPINNALCSNTSLSPTDNLFINSSCASGSFDQNSTTNFSQVYPRLCKINVFEPGVTINGTSSPPTSNVVR